jgi:hypothetical protein
MLQTSIAIEQEAVFLQKAIVVPQISSVQHIAEISHEQNHGRANDVIRVHQNNCNTNVIFLVKHNFMRNVVLQFDDRVADSGILEGQQCAGFGRAVDFPAFEAVGYSAVVV